MKPIRYIVADIETKYLDKISAKVQKEIKDRTARLLSYQPHINPIAAEARVQLLSPYYSELMSFTYMQLDSSFTPLLKGAPYMIWCKDFKDEFEMVSHIVKTFREIEKDYTVTYVGYNSLNFDFWYLVQKIMMNQILVGRRLGFANFTRYQTHPHFDMSQWLANWNPSNLTPLNVVARNYGISTKIKEDMIDSEGKFLLQELFLMEEYNKVIEYAEEDVRIETELFRMIAPYYL